MAGETVLVISGHGPSPFSARGLKQTLEPIDSAKSNFHRTINGELINLAPVQFKKYKSVITCEDQEAPTLDGVFPGDTVTVQCAAELSYLTAGGSPNRPVVGGSTYADGSYSFYRPELVMMVMDFKTEKDEYGAVVSWELDLEEV